MNTDPRYLPVVALDLDGVLRVAEPADPAVVPDGLFSVGLTIHRAGYPTYAHREPEWDEQDQWTATHWLSAVGAAWARDLVDQGVTVVWATTWQHAANEYFAQPLGLPELPVAVRGEGKWWADPGDLEIPGPLKAVRWEAAAVGGRLPEDVAVDGAVGAAS